ncbi:MAG: hypothetical protein JWP91_2102 [Fibrobacteres bacterium]|nr:hypothetical protein [Fibrobacterota bacterium]
MEKPDSNQGIAGMTSRILARSAIAAGLALAPAIAQFANDFKVDFHGAGWMQAGRVIATSDTVTSNNDYTGNYLENTGALFNMEFGFNPNLQGSLGVGGIKAHNPVGDRDLGHLKGVKLGNFAFVNMASLAWNPSGTGTRSPFALTTGLFAFKYDDNIKNLGLYLIRGAVYPQVLVSGFETKEMVQSANMLGAHVRSSFGESFTQDVLLVSETDLKPKYDFSLIYVGDYRFGKVLDLGAGVNFYHALPVRGDATSPAEAYFDPDLIQTGGLPNRLDRIYALDKDTTVLAPAARATPEDSLRIAREWYSHKGVKLMGRFAFDPKELFGGLEGAMGPRELVLYGEAAVIGVKSYELIYRKVAERIPVMFGFNLPSFKLLDDLSLEVEYFNSPYMPDYAKLMEFSSPIPRSPNYNRTDSTMAPYDVRADNWKWSLYASKVLSGHVKISAQAASDHFRIGSQQPWFPTYDETFATWKDWYVMGKLAFFF